MPKNTFPPAPPRQPASFSPTFFPVLLPKWQQNGSWALWAPPQPTQVAVGKALSLLPMGGKSICIQTATPAPYYTGTHSEPS